MNRLLTKNAMKISRLVTKKTGQNTTGATLFAALFLSVFSASTFANRPAMEESSEVTTEAEAPARTEQATAEARPQAEAPSAVEVMMQHQNQQPHQTGDVIHMPATEMQPGETLRIRLFDYPRRGMSMDKVQQEYGQPMATSESVGQPPITSWTYNDRVVYFEYSTVLHVVAR